VIHIVEATVPAAGRLPAPRIDHIALRVQTPREWDDLIKRLSMSGVRYDVARVHVTGEMQWFVPLAAGLVIEFVTDLPARSKAISA
jgi:hypothetical protein